MGLRPAPLRVAADVHASACFRNAAHSHCCAGPHSALRAQLAVVRQPVMGGAGDSPLSDVSCGTSGSLLLRLAPQARLGLRSSRSPHRRSLVNWSQFGSAVAPQRAWMGDGHSWLGAPRCSMALVPARLRLLPPLQRGVAAGVHRVCDSARAPYGACTTAVKALAFAGGTIDPGALSPTAAARRWLVSKAAWAPVRRISRCASARRLRAVAHPHSPPSNSF